MRRRTVLSGAAGALAGLAGCSRVLGSDSMRVRVMRASDERAQNADAHCSLSESFVANHSVLERLLDAARDAPTGAWVSTGVDRDIARRLRSALDRHCDRPDPVCHFDGEAYLVAVGTASENP
ncbi:hypothetical protein [Halobacterium zhouii]|uniref:hypothetical protein n=1 Tax=Halobacterium zhouii TaxID=2902624 RepID=UPI001E3519A2|nr:hypothetical protein [Halobacterium zhouii]